MDKHEHLKTSVLPRLQQENELKHAETIVTLLKTCSCAVGQAAAGIQIIVVWYSSLNEKRAASTKNASCVTIFPEDTGVIGLKGH